MHAFVHLTIRPGGAGEGGGQVPHETGQLIRASAEEAQAEGVVLKYEHGTGLPLEKVMPLLL